MDLDKRTLKRIKNLSHFCNFDMKNGIATIFSNFDSIDEIVETHQSIDEKIIIKDEAIQLLYSGINIIPKEFNVNYSIFIKDLKGYNENIILNSFENAFKNIKIKNKRELNSKKIIMMTFIFIGIILMFAFVIYNKIGEIYVGHISHVIIATLMNLLFEVYFEEGALHFVLHSFYRESENVNKKRFLGINIVQHNI